MIGASFGPVWIAAGITDMRKGMMGLAALAQTGLGEQPYSGDGFAFRSNHGDLVAQTQVRLDEQKQISARPGPRDCALDQTRAGQALTVPCGYAAALRDELGNAVAAHFVLLNLVLIRPEQLQTVGVVAKQIAFDQHLGNIQRHRLLKLGGN